MHSIHTFSRRKSILFSSILVTGFFSLAEGTLRVAGYRSQAVARSLSFHVPEIRSAGYDLDPDRYWKLKPGFEGEVSANHPWMVHINTLGLRGPEVSRAKASGVVRVIVMGDSSAFGWEMREEDTFARRLESLLNARGAGRRYEVLNAGVPGYSSYQGRRYLEKELVHLSPDVVVTYFGLNDLTGAMYYMDKEQQAFHTLPHASPLAVLRRLRLWHLMVDVVEKLRRRDRFNAYFTSRDLLRVTPEDYRANLTAMRQLAEERGFQIFFVTPVWKSPDARFHDRPFWFDEDPHLLRGIAPTIDWYSAVKREEARANALYIDVAHPSAEGHALLAERMAEALLAHHLNQ